MTNRYRILEKEQDGYFSFYAQMLANPTLSDDVWLTLAGPYTRFIQAEQYLKLYTQNVSPGKVKERIHEFNYKPPKQLLD